MPPTDRDRLGHMLEAASDAIRFSAGRTRADLDHDRMLRRALIQCVEVVGEAASHLSEQAQAELPEVPWRNVRGMRNVLAHAYFSVDLDVLWSTVIHDLPGVAAALQEALGWPTESEP